MLKVRVRVDDPIEQDLHGFPDRCLLELGFDEPRQETCAPNRAPPNAIKRILLENGIEPAPLRKKEMSWETFLKAHWGAIAATDFFVIDLQTRRIEIAGIAPRRNLLWDPRCSRC